MIILDYYHYHAVNPPIKLAGFTFKQQFDMAGAAATNFSLAFNIDLEKLAACLELAGWLSGTVKFDLAWILPAYTTSQLGC